MATSAPLVVTVTCRDGRCIVGEEDLFLDITVENRTAGDIGFPLAFLRSSGPSVRLTDPRTRAETFVRTMPADSSLAGDYTVIPPQGQLRIEWVLNGEDLAQLGEGVREADAEVLIAVELSVAGQRVPFRGGDTVRLLRP